MTRPRYQKPRQTAAVLYGVTVHGR
ncbi:hypothetical protein RVW00_000746 [Enterobacter bugandensis]|nr:hypothetical protein [Enterobacter bugandensis]